ncbi:unnamed protein product [marine sediment metagenome]|uniref:Uncharacterized protein n=1 Tax=marine sediment metagenome TaxID=412755 RepID=X1USX6_9ZZZZ
MLELKPMPLATVSPPISRLLQEGFYVRFTDQWPLTLPHVKGKTFQIERTNQVPYDITRIIPGGNYCDVDMSNAAGGENIYLENTKTLKSPALGFLLVS